MIGLTQSERKELLRRIEHLQDEGGSELLLIEFLTRTGCRQCEAWRLAADQVDDTQGTVWIKTAKRGRSHLLPIPLPFATRLKAHLKAHGTLMAPMHQPTYERSATALMRAIWARWRIRLIGAKGGDVGLHGLRASYIRQVLTKSGDIRLAQQLAGHKSLASTGHYLDQVDVLKRRKSLLALL